MKIAYISCLCNDQYIEKAYPQHKDIVSIPAKKYHKLIVEGLCKIPEITKIEVISSTRISGTYYTAGKKIEENKKVSFCHLSTINVRVIHNIHKIVAIMCKILSMKKEKDTVVVLDALNISLAIGASIACKLRGIKTLGILTDLPAFVTSKSDANDKVLQKLDSYLFLTEEMNTVVNKKGKPYLVIEGQVDKGMSCSENRLEEKYNKKVCIYAGVLIELYGSKYMVDEFIKADVPNAELHLYGKGDFVDKLEGEYKAYPQIRYMGTKPNSYVVEEELKATLLINARPTKEEYTKYSFPSKNMEYMVSGTPILTTKLAGMPTEYYNYVYLIEDESEGGLARTLQEVLSKPKEELHEYGAKAKAFVLMKKNNEVQAEKIYRFLKEHLL
ncbi:MAG: glycosyltransferase [Eubacteriales bacterium]